jgi:Acyl-CoA dehydrogenase, C-terminal domain
VDDDFERSMRDTLRAVISKSTSERIGAELRDLGWSELVSETPSAFSLLYDELGRAARGTALIDQLVLSELPAPLAGGCDAMVYRAPAQGIRPPARGSTGVIAVDGWALQPPDADDRLLVLPATHAEQSLTALAITTLRSAPGLDVQTTNTLDPEGSWVRITGTVSRSEADLIADANGFLRNGVQTSARRAAATELAGLARGALALAIAHVATRTQFGRPIGSFQAVRHRLADARTLAAGTDALLENAWATGSAENVDLAFAYAGQAHHLIGSHCLQVCGAMGLTWEHDLHRYLRRGYTLDALFGPAAEITETLGAQLIATIDSPAALDRTLR